LVGDEREVDLPAGDVHGRNLHPDLLADPEGAVGPRKDETESLLVEAEMGTDLLAADEPLDEEFVDLGEETELGHAHDRRVETLADAVLHVEALEEAVRLALRLHRRPFHLR